MLDLDHLESVDRAATKGPWTYDPEDDGMIEADGCAVAVVTHHGNIHTVERTGETHSHADGRWIATFRTAAPELIKEVRRLRALAGERPIWARHLPPPAAPQASDSGPGSPEELRGAIASLAMAAALALNHVKHEHTRQAIEIALERASSVMASES